jgi:isopenicillin N synthase-like dioxygenase
MVRELSLQLLRDEFRAMISSWFTSVHATLAVELIVFRIQNSYIRRGAHAETSGRSAGRFATWWRSAMAYETSENFTPARERVADSDATVPIIDMASFTGGPLEEQRKVVAAVKQACEHVGFFGITGHGVPDGTIRAVFSEGRAFFALALEEKMRIKRPGPGISRGYNSLAGQSLGLTTGKETPPDLMESLGFGPLETDGDPYWTAGFGPVHAHTNLWPERPPDFGAAVSDYWRAMERLSADLMRVFALALDLEEDFFLSRSDRHVTNMRVNYYPAQQRPPEPGQLRAGAHSDYGAFTVLKGESAPGGLEVLRRGGDWTPVPLVEDGFIINIGDLLMRWTNDKWVSTVHRVVNPPEAVRRKVDRMSIAFFFTPNHDVEVRCLESCMDTEHPARYAPVTAGAHWRGKILASRQITIAS